MGVILVGLGGEYGMRALCEMSRRRGDGVVINGGSGVRALLNRLTASRCHNTTTMAGWADGDSKACLMVS